MSKVITFTGNRGEWSEPYALLQLLCNPQLIFCNGSLIPVAQSQYQVKSVEVPASSAGGTINFSFSGKDVIAKSSKQTNIVPQSVIQIMLSQLLDAIKNSSSTTFQFIALDELWNSLLDPEMKSVSSIKSDIKIEILDTASNINQKYSFSIKSRLGSPTSLLNASQKTNFSYLLNSKLSFLNSTPKQLGYSVKNLPMSFVGADSQIYKNNLNLINCDLEKIIMHCLINYYGSNRKKYVKDILSMVKNSNPLNYSNLNDYDSVFGHFLEATAFGMVPNSVWNGAYSVDGGILVVTETGKTLCFFLPDKASNAACRDFLIQNSFFDTASTSRHLFGSLINGDIFKFNLLIRI
jgi:type II restriction enzyme